jgi:peptide/nickel transport system permease protein
MDKGKKALIFAAAFVAAVLLVSVIGQFYTPHDPNKTMLSMSLLSPSSEYPLGTDKLGRDILSRILSGASNTVFSALVVTVVSFSIGTLLGITAGFFGKRYEKVIMAGTTLFQAFPQFVLVVALAGIMGNSLRNSIIALIIVSWVPYARVSRSLVLCMKSSDYIKAAQMCGAGRLPILTKYILPNVVGPIIVTAMLDICNVILSLAALSYLGLGAAKPAIEWGTMMSEAKQTMLQAPWGIIFPGIAIFIVVTAFNYLGEKIGESLNEKR